MQCIPHLQITFGGPDARMLDAAGFVIGARDIEWQAMFINYHVAKEGIHFCSCGCKGLFERTAGGCGFLRTRILRRHKSRV